MRWKLLSSYRFWKSQVLTVKRWKAIDLYRTCPFCQRYLRQLWQTGWLHTCEKMISTCRYNQHTGKTAVPKQHDSVIRSIDECKGVILLLIDLSAAFDTIGHAILLNTLSNTIGVKDRCLSWFAAYLQHRQYTVLIAGEQSKPHKLTCGVPQGSVLGPLLFTIYMTPLVSILRTSWHDLPSIRRRHSTFPRI